MANGDITQGYNAVEQGIQDNSYIGQDVLRKMLEEEEYRRERDRIAIYNQYAMKDAPEKLGILKDSKFNKYIGSITDRKNIEQIKAAKQSIADKAFNGTVGFAVNTLATFADNTLGTAAGVANAGIEGVKSIGTDESIGSALIRGFVTNPVTSAMQGLRDWSRDVAPIYRTEQLGNRSVGDMLTDPNFWFDDMLVNAGFTVGSMLSMYNGAYGTFKNPKGWFQTTKYVAQNPLQSSHALINKIANKTTFGKELSRIELSKKYTRLGKINELVNSVEKEMIGKGPVNVAPYINYNTKFGKIWNAWKASSGEARMEAYNAYSDFITDQSNALEERYNSDREKILSSDSDKKDIELKALEQRYKEAKASLQSNASTLAGFVFAQNKVILTLSNAVDQQFFLRPVVKSRPNLIMRSSESLNKLKGAEVKEAISTAAREGNLNAKTLLKNVKEKEAKEELQAAVKELGGEKAFNELLEKAAETASKTGKEVTEVLDSYVNTAAVIDGVFRDTSAKVVRGSVRAAVDGEKELVKPGILRRGFDYAFGDTKSKRQAIIQGLIIKPTQEGWEELAQAWAEQNAKSFYTSEIQAIMDDRKNDRSALNLFDPAGFLGMLNAIFTSMSDDSTGRSLSAESWNTVWDTRWNEGFMGWMTGLLGTVNPAGMYTRRKMKKAAKQKYEEAVALNKSLKETFHLSDEEFKNKFTEYYLEEQNRKKQYEDWSKLKISRDVWSNELFSALDEANEYKKNMEQSVANAQKFYADTDAVKARIRSVAESLAANRKAEFADLDEDLAITAAQEELLAQIGKAYELGISPDFIKKIEQVYADVEQPVNGQDEVEAIKAHLQKIGLMEADDTEESTPEPAQGENQEGENKPKKKEHINTVFDNILLDSRGDKIGRVNRILQAIKENIKEKAAAYENLRDKLDSDNYDFLSNESKDMIAKAIVMHRDTCIDLQEILEGDVTSEINIALIDIINYTSKDKDVTYKYDENSKRIVKDYGDEKIYMSIEDFVKDVINNFEFTSDAAKKIGRIRSLREKINFWKKEQETINNNKNPNNDQVERKIIGDKKDDELLDTLDNSIKTAQNELENLVNELQSRKIYQKGKEHRFTDDEYEYYHRVKDLIKKGRTKKKALDTLQKRLIEVDEKEEEEAKEEREKVAQMLDLDIEDEYITTEENEQDIFESKIKQVKTSQESKYLLTVGEKSQIFVNDRMQHGTNELIEKFLVKAMKAYDLHKAIAGALDQGKNFEMKLKEYRKKYSQLIEDHQTDEYLSWIDQEDYLEIFDLLHYLDVLYEQPDKENGGTLTLKPEQIIKLRSQIIDKLERSGGKSKEALEKAIKLDQALDIIESVGEEMLFEVQVVEEGEIKTKHYAVNTKKIIERIIGELRENKTTDYDGEFVYDEETNSMKKVNPEFNAKKMLEKIIDCVTSYKETYGNEVMEKEIEESEKKKEKVINEIKDLRELEDIKIGKETMIKRAAEKKKLAVSFNKEISTEILKPNVPKEEKKNEDEDKYKDGTDESKKGEGGTIEQGSESTEIIPEEEKGPKILTEEEEINLVTADTDINIPEEKVKNNTTNNGTQEGSQEGNGTIETVNDDTVDIQIDGAPIAGEAKLIGSSRVPAYETRDLKNKKLVENDNINAKLARALYQGFVDSGKLIDIIQEKLNNGKTEEEATQVVLMKMGLAENNAIEQAAKATDIDLNNEDNKKKINSIIYLAVEIASKEDLENEQKRIELQNKYGKYLNVVEVEGNLYAIIGMYNDSTITPGETDPNAQSINEVFSKLGKGPKVLRYGKDGGVVKTNIRRMYSGRIANRDKDGRKKLSRIRPGQFKNIEIYAYIQTDSNEYGYIPFYGETRALSIHDTETDAERLDKAAADQKASGSYYALIRANDGKIYRIALQMARYNEEFVNGGELVTEDERVDSEKCTHLKTVNERIEALAKNLLDFLNGNSNKPLGAIIGDHQTKMLNWLCQITKNFDNGTINYNRLIAENENGTIVLRFSKDQDTNNKVEITKESSIEDVIKNIKDLYMKQNFRFRFKVENRMTFQVNQLIDSGLMYIDLQEKTTGTDQDVIIFHDSSFEVDEVKVTSMTVNGTKIYNISINGYNGQLDTNNEKQATERQFNNRAIKVETKNGRKVVTLAPTSDDGYTLRTEIIDGESREKSEIIVTRISKDGEERTVNKTDEDFTLGVSSYAYALEAQKGDKNFSGFNYYGLVNNRGELFAYVYTGGSNTAAKVVTLNGIDKEQAGKIEQKYKEVSPQEFSNYLKKVNDIENDRINEESKNKKMMHLKNALLNIAARGISQEETPIFLTLLENLEGMHKGEEYEKDEVIELFKQILDTIEINEDDQEKKKELNDLKNSLTIESLNMDQIYEIVKITTELSGLKRSLSGKSRISQTDLNNFYNVLESNNSSSAIKKILKEPIEDEMNFGCFCLKCFQTLDGTNSEWDKSVCKS